MSASGTNLEDLLTMLRTKRRRLPFEIGAFLALQVAEALLERPRRAEARNVLVSEDGKVAIVDAESCDERVALTSLLSALTALLAAAGEGVPPMLLRLVEQSPDSEHLSLGRFRDELEASLVPLNRSAAERVLARTLRDIRREASVDVRALASAEDADLDLDALISGEAPPQREQPVVLVPRSEDARPSTRPPADGEQKRSIFKDEGFADDFDGLEERGGQERPRAGLVIAVVALVLAAIGAIVLALRTPDSGESSTRTSAAAPAEATPPPVATRGEVTIELEPEGAVARLFVGQVPTLVDDVPVGVAQELVALSSDGSFVRSVVAANASYQDVDGLPELSVEVTGPSERGQDAIGTSSLRADSMGASTGRSGRLRVQVGPEGSRVYRTIGFSPMARLIAWPVNRSAELLVSAPGHTTRRVVLSASDFHLENGQQRASLRVSLTPVR